MNRAAGGSFDPETIQLLREVLDDAWATLRPAERAHATKSELAARILKYASNGERDPIRLRTRALLDIITSPL